MKTTVNVLWNSGPVKGRVMVTHGTLTHAAWTAGKGTVTIPDFSCRTSTFCRMKLTIEGANLKIGAFATTVTILTDQSPFTFFLRDVSRETPIFIPAYGVAVTAADDERSFDEIQKHIRDLALRTKIQTINAEPEESFDQAARHSRNMWVPTWLGLGRDHRIFELDFNHLDMPDNHILPRWRPNSVTKEELENSALDFRFVLERGTSASDSIRATGSALKNVATCFGPPTLDVTSNTNFDTLSATIACKSNRRPKTVEIRLPHPLGRKATSVSAGTYNPDTETICINNFKGHANIGMSF